VYKRESSRLIMNIKREHINCRDKAVPCLNFQILYDGWNIWFIGLIYQKYLQEIQSSNDCCKSKDLTYFKDIRTDAKTRDGNS